MTTQTVAPHVGTAAELDPCMCGEGARYAPLIVSQAHDIREVVATMRRPSQDDNADPYPHEFILAVEHEVATFTLQYSGGAVGEIVWAVSGDDSQDLVRKILANPKLGWKSTPECYADGCRDVVVGYRLLGKTSDGKWCQYSYGPLVFRCPLKSHESDGPTVKSGDKGPNTPDGPFMTKSGFNPAFMSANDQEG